MTEPPSKLSCYTKIHSCTDTFMHRYIHAQILSCTDTFMHTILYIRTYSKGLHSRTLLWVPRWQGLARNSLARCGWRTWRRGGGRTKDSAVHWAWMIVSYYTLAKMHRMPYLHRSFSAQKPYRLWFFCGKRPATEGILCIFATVYCRMFHVFVGHEVFWKTSLVHIGWGIAADSTCCWCCVCVMSWGVCLVHRNTQQHCNIQHTAATHTHHMKNIAARVVSFSMGVVHCNTLQHCNIATHCSNTRTQQINHIARVSCRWTCVWYTATLQHTVASHTRDK